MTLVLGRTKIKMTEIGGFGFNIPSLVQSPVSVKSNLNPYIHIQILPTDLHTFP